MPVAGRVAPPAVVRDNGHHLGAPAHEVAVEVTVETFVADRGADTHAAGLEDRPVLADADLSQHAAQVDHQKFQGPEHPGRRILHPDHQPSLVVEPLHAVAAQGDRRVEVVVPHASVEPGRLGPGAGGVEAQCIGARDEERIGIAGVERIDEGPQVGIAVQRSLVHVAGERRFGGEDEADVGRGLGHQLQQVALLRCVVARELVVAVHVGLQGGDRTAFGGLFVVQVDDPGEEHRPCDRQRGPRPPPGRTVHPRLEDQQIGDQHPERAAEHARIFVPLHQPDVVRESVAQDEPGPGEGAHRVPVFGGDPARDEEGVGQRLRGLLRDGMEEHEGHHVQERRGEGGRHGAHGRRIPDPPDGREVPAREDEQRPAEYGPPRPARAVVGGADPEQGDEAGEEGDSAETEPPGSEQHDRRQRGDAATQRKRTFHATNVIQKCTSAKGCPDFNFPPGNRG